MMTRDTLLLAYTHQKIRYAKPEAKFLFLQNLIRALFNYTRVALRCRKSRTARYANFKNKNYNVLRGKITGAYKFKSY